MDEKTRLFVAVAVCGLVNALSAVEIKVDFSEEIGPVKPVNAVGQPPMVGQLGEWGMFHYLKDAGIPYSRLHDVGGWLGNGLYVDIPNLFPDFDADETDPKNYRFAFTDSLLLALEKNNVEPFFRLGVTIENWVGYDKYNGGRHLPAVKSHPPKDFAKWARICEKVISHYTEGWADGYRMKITYWEIWNEPDNEECAEGNPMFQASFADYIRLYGVAATHLKQRFPHLKVGGYGSCGFYAGVGSDRIQLANSSPRLSYFVTCARQFLSAARDNGWPLDFFSYHSYSQPSEAIRQVRYADELLTSYGYTSEKCERVFNEWLPFASHESLGSAKQAAAIAAEMVGLQNGPCNLACIYDAKCGVGDYSPLFNPMTYKPHKAYYAFMAFNELRKLGTAVRSASSDPDVWVSAAKGNGRKAVMVANLSEKSLSLDLDFPATADIHLTDETRTWEKVSALGELQAYAFAVIVF